MYTSSQHFIHIKWCFAGSYCAKQNRVLRNTEIRIVQYRILNRHFRNANEGVKMRTSNNNDINYN